MSISSVIIKQKDINILNEVIISSNKDEYKNKIKEYEKNFSASEEKVISLVLSVAIMLNEEEKNDNTKLIEYILKDCTNYDIFQDYNLIDSILRCDNPQILESLQTSIDKISQINPTPEKITLDNIKNVSNAMSISRNAGKCYQGIMKQVYTQESLNSLVDMMGGEDEIYDISY
ncbi:MAG: hypothetical protein LN567_00460 [Rickettsia endosymbiont of Graphium doson]|nr:hypothetical protein [Rickettsia endosymbiont of Graphium doson]